MDEDNHLADSTKSSPQRSLISSLLSFGSRSLFIVTALVGIGLVWYRDRRELEKRIVTLEERLNPPVMMGNSWDTVQATGAPNTLTPGDRPTAWASATPDSQPEWLELGYDKRVRPHLIEIHESYNPGAVYKVTAFDKSGAEIVLWEGTDPTGTGQTSGITKIPVSPKFATDTIRVYIASDKVLGWNEIDAVGLQYGMWGTIWAKTAKASSSFGNRSGSSPYLIY